jgi:hypothetical protein
VGRARTVVQRPTIHASAATHGAHASAQNAAAAEVLGYTRTSLTFTYDGRARLRYIARRPPPQVRHGARDAHQEVGRRAAARRSQHGALGLEQHRTVRGVARLRTKPQWLVNVTGTSNDSDHAPMHVTPGAARQRAGELLPARATCCARRA